MTDSVKNPKRLLSNGILHRPQVKQAFIDVEAVSGVLLAFFEWEIKGSILATVPVSFQAG
jgi:hypothetical protein